MQTLKPISDASIGGWTTNGGATTNLYDTLDEAVASDADYVKSSPNPSQDVLRLKLTTGLSEPTDNTGYGIDYRIFKQGALSGNLTVRLVEGASTVIASWTHFEVTTTPTEFNQTLTTTQADAITNHNDLYIEFIADQGAVYFVNDQFLTDQDPLTTGAAEPVGDRFVVGVQWWIEEDELRGGSQVSSPTWDASKVRYGAQARTAGRTFIGLYTPEDAASPAAIGFATATTVADPTTDGNAFLINNYDMRFVDQGTTPMLAGGIVSSTRDTHPKEYLVAIAQQEQGALYLLSTFDTDYDTSLTGYYGGIPKYPLARLAYRSDRGTQALYPMITAHAAVDTLNPYPHGHRLKHARVRDIDAFAEEGAYSLFYDRVTRANSTTAAGGPFVAVDGTYGVDTERIYYVSGGTWPMTVADAHESNGIFRYRITAPTTLTNGFGVVLRQIDKNNFLRLWNNFAATTLSLQSWVNGGFNNTHANFTVNWVAGQTYEIVVIMYEDFFKILVDGVDPSGSGGWQVCDVHTSGTRFGPFMGSTGCFWDDLMFYPHYITLPAEFEDGAAPRRWGSGEDVYIYDSFTGTDGATIDGTVTDTGSATWTLRAGTMQHSGNTIVTSGTGPFLATVPQPATDYEITSIISRSVAGNGMLGGVVFKYNPADGRGVWVRLLWGGTSEIELVEINPGSPNGEHNGIARKVDLHQKLSTGAAVQLKVQVIGNDIRVYLDGHPKMSHRLSQGFDGTHLGIYEEGNTSTVWEDFYVKSVETSENIALPIPTSNRIVGIGDSITVASHNTGGTTPITYQRAFQPRLMNPSGNVGGYLTWAMILPVTGRDYGDGRFEFVGTHATGGAQAIDILNNHINGTDSPLNDDPKPSFCVVLAGSNNIGAVAPSGVVDYGVRDTVADTIEEMWDTLIANGIMPIACLLPPNNGVGAPAIPAINDAIRQRAAAKGLVIADLFTPCAEAGTPNWATNMHNGDGTHPSILGAKLMGQALRDAIEPLLLPEVPNLVTRDTDEAADLVLHNGAFDQDTNGDNIPDGGGQNATTTFWSAQTTEATTALVDRAPFSGKAWRYNRTSDAGTTAAMISSSGGSDNVNIQDQHVYEYGFMAEVPSITGTQTATTEQFIKITGEVPIRLTLYNDFSFTGPIAPFKFRHVFHATAGGTIPSGGYRGSQVIHSHATGSATDNLVDWYWGQLTIRDLGIDIVPFRDTFDVADIDPLVDATATPGPGTRDVTGTEWRIVNGALFDGMQPTSPVWGNSKVVEPSRPRVHGLTMRALVVPSDRDAYLGVGLATSAAVTDPTVNGHHFMVQEGYPRLGTPSQMVELSGLGIGTYGIIRALEYYVGVTVFEQGAVYWISGAGTQTDLFDNTNDIIGIPTYPNIRILWVDDAATTTPLFPHIGALGANAHGHWVDDIRFDVVEEWASDMAMAGFLDRFTRADSTTSVGTGWTVSGGVAGISSNKAYVVSNEGTRTLVKYANAADSPDGIWRWKVTVGSTTSDTIECIFRYVDDSNFGLIQFSGGSMWMYDVVGGTGNVVANYPTPLSAGQQIDVCVITKGNFSQLYYNGLLRWDWTAGSDGITKTGTGIGYGTYATAASGARWDDIMWMPSTMTLPLALREGAVPHIFTEGATIATDTFTAADGTALDGRTTTTGGLVYSVQGTGWEINSNRARNTNVNGGPVDYLAFLECSTPDISWEATLTAAASGDRILAGAVLRYTDANNFLYVRLWEGAEQATNNEIEILEYVGGVPRDITKNQFGDYLAMGSSHVLKCHIVDNLLHVFLDGEIAVSYIVQSNFTGTKHGLYHNGEDDGTAFDNLTIKALA